MLLLLLIAFVIVWALCAAFSKRAPDEKPKTFLNDPDVRYWKNEINKKKAS